MKKLLLILGLVISPFLYSQSIYKSSIDSGGASTNNGNIQIISTIGEVNIQELSAGNINISEGFVGEPFKIIINAKVFLQGPLINPAIPGLMNDELRNLGYLPTTSPYEDETMVDISIFNTTGNDAIVDWIWVELRAGNDITTTINKRSALLQRDGDIVDLDGVSTLTMIAAPTNYYVVVEHRNHLGAATAATVALNKTTATVVDFKTNATTTYGSNARVNMGSGNYALWAGITNGNSNIVFSGAGSSANVIKDFVLAHPSNAFNLVTFSATGYVLIDVNLNGIGRFSGADNDSNIIKDNILAHPANAFNLSTFNINTTIP